MAHTEKPNYKKSDPIEPVDDSFEWQYDIIARIKEWYRRERHEQRDLDLTPQDAFKSFDIDFDGKVSRHDIKVAIRSFLAVPDSEITDLRIDRLLRLLSFYKTETLQPSDFERLLNDGPNGEVNNPFLNEIAPYQANQNFKKSMGGGFALTNIHEWKMAAL